MFLLLEGVFFWSPFARSDCFKWFDGYEDWKRFKVDEKEEATKEGCAEEEYHVKRNTYGRSQKERNTTLLEGYWKQCTQCLTEQQNQPQKKFITG